MEALDAYIEEAQARGRSKETVRRTALACFLFAALLGQKGVRQVGWECDRCGAK